MKAGTQTQAMLNYLRALAVAALLLTTPSAQGPSPQEKIAALKESLAANQAALKQYSWVETTAISMKGEVKKQEQKRCSYGADGKVQKTPIDGAAQPAAKKEEEERARGGRRGGGGRVKEAVIENKVEDLKDYMERVAALVHEYVPPDPQKLQAAQAAGHLTVQPSPGGAAMLQAKDYVKPGDSLSIGFDSALKLSSYNSTSYVEKPKDDDVTLAVTFGKLPDGTAFPQQVLLDVKAKQIQVKVTNSGHQKSQ
jgi:hypothetical protein